MNNNRVWKSIGGDLEASYDGNRYVDIRVKTNHLVKNPNPNRVLFASKETVCDVLKLFPDAEPKFKLGDHVRTTLPARDEFPEITDTGIIVAIRITSVEKLVLTNKQETQLTIERTYDVQEDNDSRYVSTSQPERWLTLIK